MLQKLFIQNYALIRELDLDLKSGFTAITGETGSGKSILLGALGLTLGDRADTSVLFEKDLKCIVEVEFDLSQHQLEQFFKQHDLDYLPESTLRREISPSGRSRAFINDSPVSLSTLRLIGDQLVDIHSQHQTLLLRDEQFQLALVDLFADHGSNLQEYQRTYKELLSKQEVVRKIKAYISKNKIDRDYLLFQLEELASVNLEEGEEAKLAEEFGLLDHAQEIKSVLRDVISHLDSEKGLLDQLNSMSHRLDGISSFTKGLEDLSQRVESVRLELDDINNSIESIESTVEFDPERQEILRDSIDAYQRLFTKHHVEDINGLIELKKEIETNLTKSESTEAELATLTDEIEELTSALQAKSILLTDARNSAKPHLIQAVSSQFEELSLNNAKFDFRISQSPDYHLYGRDEINLLFNANKGGELELLGNVASGGELSRLMLILKGELARAKHLPTLIFDEIDSGVSGEIASQMAGKLRGLSEGRQVIAITHLPQVAARSHQHYSISKSDTEERSITDVQILDHDGRILELAKMLSGTRISDASVDNAKDLLSN